MIEDQTIDGRPALVAYLDDQFKPVTQDKATAVKVVFTDEEGGTLFLTPSDSDGAERAADKRPS